MTAIHLPPGSPSGQNLDTNTLRAQLSANKLAALLPSASANSATIRQSDGTAPQAADVAVRSGQQGQLPHAPAAGSTRETLSFAARTILGLLGQGDSGPLRSAGPLLPVPPSRLPNAAMQTQQALITLVQDSGLFYESHLAQWVSGERGLASMAREPQAGIGRVPYPGGNVPQGGTQAGPAVSSPAGPTAGLYGGMPGTAGRSPMPGPLPALPPTATPAAETPANAFAGLPASQLAAALHEPLTAPPATGHLAATDSADAPQSQGHPSQTGGGPTGSEAPRALQSAAQAYQAAASDAARQATASSWGNVAADLEAAIRPDPAMARTDVAPAVHPDTEGIVRQQLELLATHQFRWAGEAWPGTPMQWEITDQKPRGGNGSSDEQGGDGERTWSSRLVLELPQLGTVEARLTLTPAGLETRLTVQEERIAVTLDNAQNRLRQGLSARGIELLHFSIGRDNGQQEAV